MGTLVFLIWAIFWYVHFVVFHRHYSYFSQWFLIIALFIAYLLYMHAQYIFFHRYLIVLGFPLHSNVREHEIQFVTMYYFIIDQSYNFKLISFAFHIVTYLVAICEYIMRLLAYLNAISSTIIYIHNYKTTNHSCIKLLRLLANQYIIYIYNVLATLSLFYELSSSHFYVFYVLYSLFCDRYVSFI